MTSISQSPYTLVVCEKPDAARRVARALGNSSFKERSGLPPVFYVTDRRNERFVVCSAVGHLYGLVDVNRNRSAYPVFDIKWAPILKKTGIRYEQIIKSISLLSQNATKFVHACDYDQEGEVIGYNILQYACNNKYENSLRAKFSTLTDEEIRNSFDNLLKPSKGLTEAGRSRHMIDFIYGVNLSRALTQSFKVSNDGKRYCNLSIGRVQGPTLAFVVDIEMEIRKHIPEPYWTISGYNVDTFTDSFEALKHFVKLNRPYYDLVILDIRMPGMNGIQLYQKLKRIDDDSRVIFVTALDAAAELVSILPDLNPPSIIRKPICAQDFIYVVKKAATYEPMKVTNVSG